jgi:hypothetical protein
MQPARKDQQIESETKTFATDQACGGQAVAPGRETLGLRKGSAKSVFVSLAPRKVALRESTPEASSTLKRCAAGKHAGGGLDIKALRCGKARRRLARH